METRDHGDWTCVISDNLSLDTVKQVVRVGVVVPGDVSLSPDQVSAVQLGEGDTGQLVCRVDNVWPAPTISWTLDNDEAMMSLDSSAEVWLESRDQDHLVSLTHTVTLTGTIPTPLTNVSCVVTQSLDNGEVSVQTRSVGVQVMSSSALRNSGHHLFIDKVSSRQRQWQCFSLLSYHCRLGWSA